MAALRRGLDIIGIYHSHPIHPPVASPRDLAWATWPGYSYLITEVRDGQRRRQPLLAACSPTAADLWKSRCC
jgi:proteasome lid subunit RPN8/RPN11